MRRANYFEIWLLLGSRWTLLERRQSFVDIVSIGVLVEKFKTLQVRRHYRPEITAFLLSDAPLAAGTDAVRTALSGGRMAERSEQP